MDELVKSVIAEIAVGLQKYVYIREEGNSLNPDDAIVYTPFKDVNQLLVNIAKKHGVTNFIEESEGIEKFSDKK